ncbi:hypothetical protein [Ascidiimonas sp. W6]|uniref:hypothetical protein n=1 Tax=Ascidiimonas meishanensis TaxID=3128903 RepID=UPI0030EEB2FC
MTKPQKTALILGIIGIVLIIVAQQIDTPWNSGASMFDSSDNYQENIWLKRGILYPGILLLVIGGIKFITSLNTKSQKNE